MKQENLIGRTSEELKMELIKLEVQAAVKEAYEQGVQDAASKYRYPPILKKEHLAEILSVEKSTVEKIVMRPSFPKLTTVRARYPRDRVFDWIEQQIESGDASKTLTVS